MEKHNQGGEKVKVVMMYVGDKKQLAITTVRKGHKYLATGKVLAVTPVANDVGFIKVMGAILGLADYLCWGVIVFAGTSWMLGNRTKAIEHIIGGSSGYLIIRHAKDIRDFLKEL